MSADYRDYLRWAKKVASVARVREADFDDYVQEMQIAMWRATQKVDDRGAHAKWLTRAAEWRMTELLSGRRWFGEPGVRGQQRNPALTVWESVREDDLTRDDEQTDPRRDIQVRDAVRKLPERQRQYVFRMYWLGMTNAEAARDMGITEPAARLLRQRAHQRLRSTISQELTA